MAWIVIEDGTDTIVALGASASIGRNRDNDIIVIDDEAPDLDCRVERRGEEYVVLRKGEEWVLRDMDTLVVGRQQLRFVADSDMPPKLRLELESLRKEFTDRLRALRAARGVPEGAPMAEPRRDRDANWAHERLREYRAQQRCRPDEETRARLERFRRAIGALVECAPTALPAATLDLVANVDESGSWALLLLDDRGVLTPVAHRGSVRAPARFFGRPRITRCGMEVRRQEMCNLIANERWLGALWLDLPEEAYQHWAGAIAELCETLAQRIGV